MTCEVNVDIKNWMGGWFVGRWAFHLRHNVECSKASSKEEKKHSSHPIRFIFWSKAIFRVNNNTYTAVHVEVPIEIKPSIEILCEMSICNEIMLNINQHNFNTPDSQCSRCSASECSCFFLASSDHLFFSFGVCASACMSSHCKVQIQKATAKGFTLIDWKDKKHS